MCSAAVGTDTHLLARCFRGNVAQVSIPVRGKRAQSSLPVLDYVGNTATQELVPFSEETMWNMDASPSSVQQQTASLTQDAAHERVMFLRRTITEDMVQSAEQAMWSM